VSRHTSHVSIALALHIGTAGSWPLTSSHCSEGAASSPAG
jgi:hypothetical protein